MSRFIPLTKGQFATVDDADFDWLSQWKWYAHTSGLFYAKRRHEGRILAMHRVIMDAAPPFVVDHINGDTLDNRRANLRVCTSRQNHQNVALKRNTKSGFKGVERVRNGWRARIAVDRVMQTIGSFDTPEEAARAYDAAAREMFGGFARLNFPEVAA